MHIFKAATARVALAFGALPSAALAAALKVFSTFVPPMHACNRMLTAWGQILTINLFPVGQLGPPPRCSRLHELFYLVSGAPCQLPRLQPPSRLARSQGQR